MGEAKRKRLAAAEAAERLTPEMVPDFFKGIAGVIGSLITPPNGRGGECVLKSLLAYQAVRSCGLDASIVIGGALVRVGPCPTNDTIAWCGPGNAGQIFRGAPLFHSWVRYRDWIFDAGVGDWKALNMPEIELRALGTALPPPQWDIELPSYWLKRADEVHGAWRPHGTPELGEAWYGPFRGDAGPIAEGIREMHAEYSEQFAWGLRGLMRKHHIEHHIDAGKVYPLKLSVCTATPVQHNNQIIRRVK